MGKKKNIKAKKLSVSLQKVANLSKVAGGDDFAPPPNFTPSATPNCPSQGIMCETANCPVDSVNNNCQIPDTGDWC